LGDIKHGSVLPTKQDELIRGKVKVAHLVADVSFTAVGRFKSPALKINY